MRYIATAAFLICIGLGVATRAEAQSGLQGVWQVIEVKDQSGINNKPQPGLYVFTKGYYSVVEVLGRTERPDLMVDENATTTEILAMFGPSFRSQAGTYQATNGRITFGTVVSKSPAGMKRGTPGQGSYALANGVLTLTTGQVVRKLKRLE